MVDSNMIHCFLVQTTVTITQALYQVQTILAYYLKTNHLHIKKKYKSFKNFIDLRSHKHDFGISAEWVFFATNYCKYPCDGIGGAVKTTCSQTKPPKVFE